jgi:hypothetical protein
MPTSNITPAHHATVDRYFCGKPFAVQIACPLKIKVPSSYRLDLEELPLIHEGELRECKTVYYILRITSNVGNRDSVLYWYLYCGGSNPPVLSFLTGCDRPLGGSPWPIIELRS